MIKVEVARTVVVERVCKVTRNKYMVDKVFINSVEYHFCMLFCHVIFTLLM